MSKTIFNPLLKKGLQSYPSADEYDDRYLKLDASNDPITGDLVLDEKLGIGTNNPQTLVHLVGPSGTAGALTFDSTTANANTQIEFRDNGTQKWAISKRSNNDFWLAYDFTTATTPLMVRSNGNVGIGTTSPATILHLNSSSTLGTELRIQNNSATGNALFFFSTNLGTSYLGTAGQANAFFPGTADGDFVMNNRTGGDIKISAGGSSNPAQLTITNGGDVGIATTSPSAKLHVAGNSDQIQQIVQAHSTQTTNLTEWQNSSGTILSGFDERGILFSDGGIDVSSVFIGFNAGKVGATGTANVGIGRNSLSALTSGQRNNAVGWQALTKVTTGSFNMAFGYTALANLTTGSSNSGIGNQALNGVVDGNSNIGIGSLSVLRTTSGDSNVGIGDSALQQNVTGNENVAIGQSTLRGSVGDSFSSNTAIGAYAGTAITTGSSNVLIGFRAGESLTTESNTLYIANSNTTTPLIYGVFSGSTAGVTIHSQNVSGVPLTVKGVVLQTGNLTEWQNSSGTVLNVVDSDGNVGIGTASPDEKLHVSGISAGEGAHIGNAYLGVWDGGSTYFALSHDSVKTDVTKYALLQLNNGAATYLNAGTTIGLRIGNSQKVTIDSIGNVGIGTTSPGAKLHIAGTADDQQLIVQANATQTANVFEIQNSSGNEKLEFRFDSGVPTLKIGETQETSKFEMTRQGVSTPVTFRTTGDGMAITNCSTMSISGALSPAQLRSSEIQSPNEIPWVKQQESTTGGTRFPRVSFGYDTLNKTHIGVDSYYVTFYGGLANDHGNIAVKAGSGQTANLMTFLDSSNNTLLSVKKDGVVNFASVSPTSTAGDLWFDGGALHFKPATDDRSVNLANGVIIADTTVSNTTTETTVFTEGVSANELYKGSKWITRVSGYYSTANASDTFTMRLKVGGTTIQTFTSTAENVTNGYFEINWYFTVRSIGATGSIMSSVQGIFNNDAKNEASTTPDIIDTTIAEDLTMSIQWSASNPGNSLTVTQGHSEILGIVHA